MTVRRGFVYQVSCTSCRSVARVENTGPDLVIIPGRPVMYCPYCGSPNVERVYMTALDADEYWRALAPSIGLPASQKGAELTKSLYDLWDKDKYHRFVDFVEAFSKGEE